MQRRETRNKGSSCQPAQQCLCCFAPRHLADNEFIYDWKFITQRRLYSSPFLAADVTIPRGKKGIALVQNKSKAEYDVIVVGSGASGGWAAKRLAEAGLKVALLEAGKPQSDVNFTEHKPEFELKYRNHAKELLRKTRPIQSRFACTEYNSDWFVNDVEE